VKAVYKQETADEDISSHDLTSVTSAAAADDEHPIFDDELELSEFLQRRSMEWMPADGDIGARRQSDSGVNAALENPDAIAALVQGDALNVIDCDLFYITIPDHEPFQRIRRLDLKGNNLTDCPVLSGMPLLEVLVLDNNFLTSHSTFHTAPLLHTLWLNHNVVANLAPLAVAFTLSFPKLSYLSMMFNPCHPSSLPGATEQSFRQYRLLIVTLLPRIEAIDAVRVDPDEKCAVQDQLKGQPRLSSVNVVDALNIEKLQPFLNPQKLPLPYSGTSILEGTVSVQSGKLFAFSSQQVYLRLSISQSSSSALCDLPMLSWAPYSASTCASCAEVERASLPPDVFETDCSSVILLPGFTIGPTKKPRSGLSFMALVRTELDS
jgi:Leucine-rich repeat (LRR) protein